MKIIALAAFDYGGGVIGAGVFDGTEAEMVSMSQFGPVRPATSTEIEESEAKPETAEAKHAEKETADRKHK